MCLAIRPGLTGGPVKSNGIAFAYIKATEGTRFKSSQFNSQYTGATNVGLIRGSYHFARPDISTGAAQATFFVANGGRWSSDGITLPGALDMEYNPYGATCYGKTQAAMVSWIKDFSNTYRARTGVYPVIYTTTSWWSTCTGNSASFGATNPLWIARYASAVGALPRGWNFYTFWQYSNSARPNPGDADVFNGDLAGLKRLASGA
ncbi:glycoside hydrolase family 25 protein [Coprinellus micaceus]|uniref:N,O-diacetylmuramidase n=1 Tax=Coprinellus micaceus TaxID=71717 RepID=A0A4Y7SG47_COPMI|nr:glycoside hydrolase family 25 protein [Coprinellus micaceus]